MRAKRMPSCSRDVALRIPRWRAKTDVAGSRWTSTSLRVRTPATWWSRTSTRYFIPVRASCVRASKTVALAGMVTTGLDMKAVTRSSRLPCRMTLRRSAWVRMPRAWCCSLVMTMELTCSRSIRDTASWIVASSRQVTGSRATMPSMPRRSVASLNKRLSLAMERNERSFRPMKEVKKVENRSLCLRTSRKLEAGIR
ncbi:MAG: hypothetical protein MUF52_05955 [Syntrophobacteraceae bacterium]|nr:hypothetical protein [Syntrophobacteraceae bacterium]